MNEIPVIAGEVEPAIAEKLAKEHVADLVDRLNEETQEDAARIIAALPFERAVEVFDQPGLDAPAELISSLPDARAASILSAMSSDRAADLFRDLEPSSRKTLLEAVDADARQAVLRILGYPENSAGAIMTTEFVSVPSDWTVGRALDHIRKVERTRETVYAIYVTDPKSGRLVRSVGLRRLVVSDPSSLIVDVAQRTKPIAVSPLAEREKAAQLISKYDLLAVPVVEDGHVIGIVTVDDIVDAILEETTEDVQKFGGVEALDEPYMKIGFLDMFRKRVGWLLVLFLSEMLTATAMQGYQTELEKAIVLTLFIPLIMSSGGNSGSQATSLIIRAMALREIGLADWWRIAAREIPTGLALGSVLGIVAICRIVTWQYLGFYDYGHFWPLVALTVGAALVGIVTFGTLAGSMLPFLLKALGFDPASASAPFVATLVDVSGLVIYFSVALVILHGTML
ncbi:MAG: magnesium transporter [Rhizobiales bacterium 65-79]|jgi:magnesium transporter|nr:magnesium transporter [Hyphomicrobiales bacterium]OJU04313.1 MAG: magnesium transporter [Rhizobiales bacterium 65-79]